MALTKIGKEGITGISNSADATFLTATSSEGVTLAGTLAVTGVHTVGNNAIYTSDGGAVTKNLVHSLVKCWIRFAGGAGTPVINDSHNIASITDNGTGDHDCNFTSNMTNDDYGATANAQDTTRRDGVHQSLEGQNTTDVNIQHYENNAVTDSVRILSLVAGDLA
tara:strand:+ start:35 stop:529 length:495 start_codon:yes stop_codon:yes gene_type:complete